MTESYFDIDGKPIGLWALCEREPHWAANRISAMRATIDELTAKIAANADGCPRCGGTGGHWNGCSAPVETPEPVEWVDGRATVGDVTVRAFPPDDTHDGRWHFDIFVTLGYGTGHRDAHLASGNAYDEATAKRIAIAAIGEQQALAALAEYSRQALQDARLDALEWMMRQIADLLESMNQPDPA